MLADHARLASLRLSGPSRQIGLTKEASQDVLRGSFSAIGVNPLGRYLRPENRCEERSTRTRFGCSIFFDLQKIKCRSSRVRKLRRVLRPTIETQGERRTGKTRALRPPRGSCLYPLIAPPTRR